MSEPFVGIEPFLKFPVRFGMFYPYKNRSDIMNFGITVEDKKRLFTRGFGKNTGLGLFLSREILAITGITITENGTPGKGARFEITVPKGMYRFMGAEDK